MDMWPGLMIHIVGRSGCTMGSRQAGGGCVMLWAMFCRETLGPAIYVDVRLGTLHGSAIPRWQRPLSRIMPPPPCKVLGMI